MSSQPLWPAEGSRFLTPRGSHIAAVSVISSSLCLLLWTAAVGASTLDFTPLATNDILLAQRAIADTNVSAVPDEAPDPSASLDGPPDVRKSPGRAFLYNVLLPGAGHLYAGNKRGWAHIGMEGVAWATFFYYRERGNSKEDEYLAYADDHWDYNRWLANCGCAQSPEDSLIMHFRENNKQHYYEDIGKLEAYAQGWDDWTSANSHTANRNFYRGMRGDSNNFLKNARYAMVGSFVNRVFSAVDVLRMLKKQSRAILGKDTRIRLKVRTKPFSDHTAVGFEIRKTL